MLILALAYRIKPGKASGRIAGRRHFKLVHYAMWFIGDNVDAFLSAFHTTDVPADALFCRIIKLCKHSNYFASILAAIDL